LISVLYFLSFQKNKIVKAVSVCEAVFAVPERHRQFRRTVFVTTSQLRAMNTVGLPGKPVRVSCGDLCAAEAPTDAAGETQAGAGLLWRPLRSRGARRKCPWGTPTDAAAETRAGRELRLAQPATA